MQEEKTRSLLVDDNKHTCDTKMPKEVMAHERQPDRKKRIHIIARRLVSKRHSRNFQGKYETLQTMIENENFVHEKAITLEFILRREVLIYDKLRHKKSRICSFRRRIMYWRLFYYYGLTVPMISWLLDVSPSTIKSNVGAAYRSALLHHQFARATTDEQPLAREKSKI